MADQEHRASDPRATAIVSSRWLARWFAVLGGMTAWAIHFWLVFGIVEIVCRTDFGGFSALGLSGLQLLLTVVTVVFGVIALAAAIVAYRVQARAGPITDPDSEQTGSLAAFMGRTGLLLNAFFFVSIILSVVPAFVLRLCE